jgi:hypothetical protein
LDCVSYSSYKTLFCVKRVRQDFGVGFVQPFLNIR